ncbi:MAG: YceI family protein [Acidimicrobiales bacterium]
MSDTPSTPTRTIDGQVLPETGTFKADPTHSILGFSVRHMMIAKVRGRFTTFDATLVVADDPLQSTLTVEVDLASVDTRDDQRDGHLRSPDFFDVETYPKMTYRSTGVTQLGDATVKIDGELDLHGITRLLSLEAVYEGVGTDPWGGQRVGFSAIGELDREDFDLTWNQPLATGGVLVGKQVRLEIETEFVRQ